MPSVVIHVNSLLPYWTTEIIKFLLNLSLFLGGLLCVLGTGFGIRS